MLISRVWINGRIKIWLRINKNGKISKMICFQNMNTYVILRIHNILQNYVTIFYIAAILKLSLLFDGLFLSI